MYKKIALLLTGLLAAVPGSCQEAIDMLCQYEDMICDAVPEACDALSYLCNLPI